jgi:hypothetical protein
MDYKKGRRPPTRLEFELVYWGSVLIAVGAVATMGWLLWRIVQVVS